MRTHVTIHNGQLRFTSTVAEHLFLKNNEGKSAWLTIDDLPTTNIRRYFEGALVPAVFYQHPKSGWRDFREAREAIKLEFLATYTSTLDGERIRAAKSTAELTKRQFNAFVERVVRWLEEQGLEVPDPEEYKAWINSAPPAGETYPQLERLKQQYELYSN